MTPLWMRLIALTLTLGVAVATTHTTPAYAGGSNIGGSGRGSAMVAEWCRGALAILDAARTQANLALTMDDAGGARDYLKQGLVAALAAGNNPKDDSLTHRALVRGIEMTEALEAALMNDSRAGEATLFFLMRYYDFIERVATRIDLQYYIPYRGTPDSGFDIQRFEQQFVVYAQDQISFVLSHFATVSRSRVTPVWTSRTFLKLLEMVSKQAAEDLSESLWTLKFACVRDKLAALSLRLAHYNAGNHSVYPNDLYAVNSSYGDGYEAVIAIYNGCTRK